MKRLCATAALLAFLASAGSAHAVSIGVGAFGGLSAPIVQDDTGQGTIFGLRVPVNLVPMITVEPYFSTSAGGDKDEELGGIEETRTGLDNTGFGANLLIPFGVGFRFFPFVGVGSHTLKRDGMDDITKTAYNFGLGIGFTPPVAGLSVDVRGELNAVVDGDVSRKWGNATVGVSYNVFKMAP
jgi:hypothetical protein